VLAPDSLVFIHNYGLDAEKDGWTRHEWCIVWPGLLGYTDLDLADDVSVLAELLELVIPVLEMMASEAT